MDECNITGCLFHNSTEIFLGWEESQHHIYSIDKVSCNEGVYRYLPLAQDTHICKLLDYIGGRFIRCSHPSFWNDPFDAYMTFSEKHKYHDFDKIQNHNKEMYDRANLQLPDCFSSEEKYKENVITAQKGWRMLSFSTGNQMNPIKLSASSQWDRYAKAFNGCCLEFDFQSLYLHFFNDNIIKLKPRNRNELPMLNTVHFFPLLQKIEYIDCENTLAKYLVGNGSHTENAPGTLISYKMKNIVWKNENELRLVLVIPTDPKVSADMQIYITMPKPRCCWIGYKVSNADKNIIKKVCTDNGVAVKSLEHYDYNRCEWVYSAT